MYIITKQGTCRQDLLVKLTKEKQASGENTE